VRALGIEVGLGLGEGRDHGLETTTESLNTCTAISATARND
jgi:hypothetical protein